MTDALDFWNKRYTEHEPISLPIVAESGLIASASSKCVLNDARTRLRGIVSAPRSVFPCHYGRARHRFILVAVAKLFLDGNRLPICFLIRAAIWNSWLHGYRWSQGVQRVQAGRQRTFRDHAGVKRCLTVIISITVEYATDLVNAPDPHSRRATLGSVEADLDRLRSKIPFSLYAVDGEAFWVFWRGHFELLQILDLLLAQSQQHRTHVTSQCSFNYRLFSRLVASTPPVQGSNSSNALRASFYA